MWSLVTARDIDAAMTLQIASYARRQALGCPQSLQGWPYETALAKLLMYSNTSTSDAFQHLSI